MTLDGKIGTVISAYCNRCGGARNCEIKGHHAESGDDGNYSWHTDWYLLTCRGCDHVFAQTVATNSEDYYQGYDRHGETFTEHAETIETWPARSKRPAPAWSQHSNVETDLEGTGPLDASLKELYGALDSDLMVLGSIGIRTSFDIAAELLGVDPAMTFSEKLDALVAMGHIIGAEKSNFEILVECGSASAHRGWKPNLGELHALMNALEDFIFGSIVFPSQQRAKKAKLAAIKAKVPRRPARKKLKPNEGPADQLAEARKDDLPAG